MALATLAFVVGRSSVAEKGQDHRSVVPQATSILTERVEMPSAERTPELAVAKEAAADKGLASDEFAERLAELVGAGNVDYTAFSQTLEAWIESDPLSAIDFLARGKHRDDMLRWIVSHWSAKHPEAASQWLAENREMEGIDLAVEGLAQGIQREDAEGALEWAKVLKDPVVQTRVWTSAGYERFRHDHEGAVKALMDSGLPPRAQDAIQESWAVSWRLRPSETRRTSHLSLRQRVRLVPSSTPVRWMPTWCMCSEAL